jgi:hypothetical protein
MLDNVATQWNKLFNMIYCRSSGALQEPNIVLAELHLAQWQALLALKRVTDSEQSQDLVVAYASHTVMVKYFPYEKVTAIDLLLDTQLTALKATKAQQTLGKRLGEAVAISLMEKRRVGREFTLGEFKSAVDSASNNPRPGLYRWLNNTPAYRAAATFIFYDIPISRPFVVYEPKRFIKDHLASIKPPIVPSAEWDKMYASIVDAGRSSPNRTAEMNTTAAWVSCTKIGNTECFAWNAIARSALPSTLSLYDTVTVLAKLAVAMHDAIIVLTTLQYGFWFWRPEMAIRAGDPHHAPIPDWKPWIRTPAHPEYPSGTVTGYSAAATVLEMFFEEMKMQPNPIRVSGGGVFDTRMCDMGGPVPDVEFKSFADAVAYSQRARMWSGAHYEKSVVDGAQVGKAVTKYVWQYWDEPQMPSGVYPDLTYLTVVLELPKKQAAWSPLRITY